MATIDKLIAQLQVEEQEDIKKVDECKDQYQDITLKKNDLDWKIENNDAKIQGHDKTITKKTDAKKVTITSIADADTKLKDMEKVRKAENDAYVQAKTDDEKAIELIGQAKAALAKYYSENSLLQQDPEPEFKLSDKSSAKNQASGVLHLMDIIVQNLQSELADAMAAEEAVQLDYEQMKKAVEEQKAELEKAKINLEGQIAQENTAKDAEEDLKKENEKALTDEKTTEADLKRLAMM